MYLVICLSIISQFVYIYIYVCVCVCVYACVRVCVCIGPSVGRFVYVSMSICLHIHLSVCLYMGLSVYRLSSIWSLTHYEYYKTFSGHWIKAIPVTGREGS
jgi:hypothetical protein